MDYYYYHSYIEVPSSGEYFFPDAPFWLVDFIYQEFTVQSYMLV